MSGYDTKLRGILREADEEYDGTRHDPDTLYIVDGSAAVRLCLGDREILKGAKDDRISDGTDGHSATDA